MATRTAHSFCRICGNCCGVQLEVADDGGILSVRGDREHPVTQGYACSKGLESGDMHRRADRILRPLKRRADGSFAPVSIESALDEIAERVRTLVDRYGPHSVGAFLGTTGYFNVPATQMLLAFLSGLGSRSFFSSHTIDSSSKVVAAGRLGTWAAGKQPFSSADVWMFVGTNPFVSLSSQGGAALGNPTKAMKAALDRGLQLIVVDVRRTETARHAAVFLQPRAGEDVAVVAGMLRIILTEGLADETFCAAHVEGLGRLREAVEPFTPAYVAERAGVPPEALRAAAVLFGGAGKRGCAGNATGVGMSPDSNLVTHLVELLNVVCGRFRRAGETIENAGGVYFPRRERHAEVVPPTRPWERGYRSRVGGFGKIPGPSQDGEVPSGILADEILEPGEGQVRALFVEGGNPVLAIPDQERVVKAFSSLDLLVSVEPFMSATARLSHFVLPPRLMYERADIPFLFGADSRVGIPFGHYTAPIVEPPPESEVVEDWYVYWALARRLGLPLSYDGVELEGEPPTTEQLIALTLRDAQVSFDELSRHPRGRVFDLERLVVQEPRPEAGRFDVMPDDVEQELGDYRARRSPPELPYRLTVRRMRPFMNSLDPAVAEPERAGRFNPAFLHPDDLSELGIGAGDRVEIVSDHSRILAIAEPDERLGRGVVSMSHCFGGLPGEDDDPRRGASTNRLVDTDRHHQAINAMPTMSGLPVAVVPAA